MTQALLLIDIQNDYFPGGAMELEGSTEAGDKAAALLRAFRNSGRPVIHVQHLSTRPGATFFLPDTEGAGIHPCVEPIDGEMVVRKHFPNAFRDTPLLDRLRDNGIPRLVIAGMMTHLCIDTTVRAAADLGFACLLAHDACATKALVFSGVTVPAGQVHAAFCAALAGSFATVRSVREIREGLQNT
jgi:nicotinamidase-related amidase